MARNFNGSTQYLTVTAAIKTGTPLTIACWYKPVSTASYYNALWHGQSGTDVNNFRLYQYSNGFIYAAAVDGGGTYGQAQVSSGPSAGTWQHLCGVFTSSASRAVYLNGGSKGTNTDSSTPTAATINEFRVGSWEPGNYMAGDIAEVAIWDIALSDAEVASLYVSAGVGVYPSDVQPAHLIAYWKLLGTDSPEPDEIGSNDLTLVGSPTSATHPTMQSLGGGGGGDVTVALSGVATNAAAGSAALPGSPIVTDLVSFWELEEVIGTRNDAHGTNHLVDNASVTQNTGKVGSCAQFTKANLEYLSHSDNASLSMGAGVTCTFVAWVYLDVANDNNGILGKWDGAQTEFALFHDASAFKWRVRNTANTTMTDLASTTPSITSGVWYFVMAQYDGSALKISVNDGTVASTSYSGDINNSDGNFHIGAWADVGGTGWSGRIDQVGFWKRALDTTEISYLYNSGNGRSYAAISSGASTEALTGVQAGASVSEFDLPGPPEEPRLYYDTTYTAPTGATITVPDPGLGGNFQTALNIANPGDIIVLNSGSTYTGHFSLPNKGSSGFYIHIVSSAAPTPVGVRVTTSQAASFPKIVTTDVEPCLTTANQASYYRFINVEFTSTSSTPGSTIFLGDENISATADFPHHLILDRCYIHGHATYGGRRGVFFCGSYQAVIDSYLSDYKQVGADTQAIASWTGWGPYKITNNYLEGAGENVMFGGSTTLINNLLPSDIEIRNNHFFKPLTWRIGDPSYLGTAWTVKNSFELKMAQRVIIENNLFENHWVHAQNGYAIVFTGRNQAGPNPWATVRDVIFRNNELRNLDCGFSLLGQDFESGIPSTVCKRLLIEDNLITGIGAYGGPGNLFILVWGYSDITINHNTALNVGSTIVLDGQPFPNFRYTNNIAQHGPYGIKGTDYTVGNGSIDHFLPGSVITANVFQSDTNYSSIYPSGQYWPLYLEHPTTPGVNDVGFTNYPTDLSLSPSSPYHNVGTDGTDLGAVVGEPTGPAFKAAFAASCNQMII